MRKLDAIQSAAAKKNLRGKAKKFKQRLPIGIDQ